MNLIGKSVGCKLSMDFFCKKTVSVIYLLEIGLTFRGKSLKIVLTEGWQSGNAPDSKSGEPANTGAQVQILYLPYSLSYKRSKNVDIQVTACNVFASFYLCEYVFEYVLLKYQYILRIALLFLLLSVI